MVFVGDGWDLWEEMYSVEKNSKQYLCCIHMPSPEIDQ